MQRYLQFIFVLVLLYPPRPIVPQQKLQCSLCSCSPISSLHNLKFSFLSYFTLPTVTLKYFSVFSVWFHLCGSRYLAHRPTATQYNLGFCLFWSTFFLLCLVATINHHTPVTSVFSLFWSILGYSAISLITVCSLLARLQMNSKLLREVTAQSSSNSRLLHQGLRNLFAISSIGQTRLKWQCANSTATCEPSAWRFLMSI
jgi:hypothetical protein